MDVVWLLLLKQYQPAQSSHKGPPAQPTTRVLREDKKRPTLQIDNADSMKALVGNRALVMVGRIFDRRASSKRFYDTRVVAVVTQETMR